jgi:hypothetical protein
LKEEAKAKNKEDNTPKLSMPRNSYLEHNNFSHPHINIGHCWMKLKKIEKLVLTGGYIAFAEDE